MLFCYRTAKYASEEKIKCTSSRPEVFCINVFLEISQSSHENTCARASLIKVAGLSLKRLLRRCFPVNFTEHLQVAASPNVYKIL